MRRFEIAGESRTLKEWAAHLGVQYKTLWMRLRDGMPPERAFTTDPGRACKRDHERTLQKVCQNCGADFVIPKCRDWRERCCSSECKTELRKAQQAESIASRKRVCETCGAGFVPRGSQLKVGGGRFCSVACAEPARVTGRTPEAAALRGQRRREKFAAGLIAFPRGEKNSRWKGGKEAYRRRRVESGASASALRRYRAANPEKVREWKQKRRSIGRLPRGTVQRIGKAQRWKCAVCCCDLKAGYHVDHVMPLALGGEHAPLNLQLLCASCNLRKSAKHPIDFMRQRGFLL